MYNTKHNDLIALVSLGSFACESEQINRRKRKRNICTHCRVWSYLEKSHKNLDQFITCENSTNTDAHTQIPIHDLQGYSLK